jgi:hypothetical protein
MEGGIEGIQVHVTLSTDRRWKHYDELISGNLMLKPNQSSISMADIQDQVFIHYYYHHFASFCPEYSSLTAGLNPQLTNINSFFF